MTHSFWRLLKIRNGLAGTVLYLSGLLSVVFLSIALAPFAMTQNIPGSGVVLFWEQGFPAADIAQISLSQVQDIFPGCDVVGTPDLAARMSSARVLVLPFGSSFPELLWPQLRQFLLNGGNLVVVGGKPFTRPAFRDSSGQWQLRPETMAFARELRIYGYQPTSGSGLAFKANSEMAGPTVPNFSWQSAWSVVIRLSEKSMDDREGSAGSLDAALHPLAWGVRDDRRLSSPAIEIDHTHHAFVGGRWVLLTCDPGSDFWAAATTRLLVRTLIDRAEMRASDFRLQPEYAVFASGEPWRFELTWIRPGTPQPLQVELTIESAGAKPRTERLEFTPTQLPFEIGFQIKPSVKAAGLQHVKARLFENGHLSAIYHTGFWMRDDQALRSGPVVTRDADFFLLDGKPTPIIGTTYMASDVQRQFFDYPNPYVWDRDMDQIARAGLNMLRTGWWTGWDRLSENGIATEKTLRALEAYILTARRHNLPVQFNLFAFTPALFALGENDGTVYFAHLEDQRRFVRSVVERFHDVPYLMWDLINEPSFSNPKRTWITRPSNDEWEQGAWNAWVLNRYGSRQQASAAWHVALPDGLIALPTDADFSGRGIMSGASPARAYDYHIFAQESFAAWATMMRTAIRATGSKQLITVGQDEGGVTNRPLTAYFASAVDFTTNHTWWLNDALLWDSLAAKQPGLPLLIQETGIQHQSALDGTPRLSEDEEARLFERKLATSLATSAGAIQWLWNTNAYMMPEMELTIGALRADSTEKREAEVLRKYAKFVREAGTDFREPVTPDIVVVTSQALQFSPLGDQAIAAQQRAIRVLNYNLHLSASVIAENQLASLGTPKLVILPCPQALTQAAWKHLTAYAQNGGTALITGPVERDEHWARVPRITALSKGTEVGPLIHHYSELQFGAERIPLTFDADAQQQLERLSLPQFVVDLPIGAGHIYTTADPVELAEGPEPTVRLYRQIATVLGLKPAFDAMSESSRILIRSTPMKDAILYLFVSETTHDESIDITDRSTGVELKFTLAPGHARIAIIHKADHTVTWSPE